MVNNVIDQIIKINTDLIKDYIKQSLLSGLKKDLKTQQELIDSSISVIEATFYIIENNLKDLDTIILTSSEFLEWSIPIMLCQPTNKNQDISLTMTLLYLKEPRFIKNRDFVEELWDLAEVNGKKIILKKMMIDE